MMKNGTFNFDLHEQALTIKKVLLEKFPGKGGWTYAYPIPDKRHITYL